MRRKERHLSTAEPKRINESPRLTDAGGEGGIIRLMLADGPTLVRGALASLLAGADRIDVVAATAGLDDSIRAAAGHKPDVVLYHPPQADNSDEMIAMISALQIASPDSKVVILTASEAPDQASDALIAGVAGYVLKSEDPADLIKAIYRASVDSPWISPQVALAIATADAGNGSSPLTEREQQILQAVALGHTNSEIGEQLHLSVRTIESHRARILRKLDLSTRAELVNYAITSGLFDTSKLPAGS
jgi:two-component system, NarL family, response regulator NreC